MYILSLEQQIQQLKICLLYRSYNSPNSNTLGTRGSALSLDDFTLCGADLTDELRFGGFSFRLRQQ